MSFISLYINEMLLLYVSVSVWSPVVQQMYTSVCAASSWKRHLHFSAMSVTHLENSVPADAPIEIFVEMTRTGRSSTTPLLLPGVHPQQSYLTCVRVYSILFVSTKMITLCPMWHRCVRQCTPSHKYCACTQTHAYTVYCKVRFSTQSIQAHKLCWATS